MTNVKSISKFQMANDKLICNIWIFGIDL